MSSSEPPSRLPPRSQAPDTKAQRDELSSKGKVEKVREVDADEARKQKKWRAAYREEDQVSGTEPKERRPSLFDLSAQARPAAEEEEPTISSQSGMSDVEDAIVPSPNYSPPPLVSFSMEDGEEDEDDVTAGALPQSDDFWEDVDFPPDQPPTPNSYQETPSSMQRGTGEPSQGVSKEAKKQKGKEGPTTSTAHAEGKKPSSAQTAAEKKGELSPFGPPGKPKTDKEPKGPIGTNELPQKLQPTKSKTPDEMKKVPSLFEEAAKTAAPSGKFSEPRRTEKKSTKEKANEDSTVSQGMAAAQMRTEDREGGGGGQRDKERKVSEIELTSAPTFTGEVQNAAATATQQATPYLHPSTASLFFQMVGTMYAMAATTGVARTEIVLNNPAFANSRFFGATISIEKYATAPDSFNITLSGSDTAVTAFRDNIPSLMAAFQQGKFAFKVNRLDVAYSVEKPHFRRKGKEDEAGGSDLGERRK